MLKNNILVCLRMMFRQKGFTIINVCGLAVGLAAVLLIMMWVIDELEYDKYNKNIGNMYMVAEDQYYTGDRYRVLSTPCPGGPVWKQKIPEIEDMSRGTRRERTLFRTGDKVFYESRVIIADPGILRIFSFPLVTGNPAAQLKDPYTIVLSEKLAGKYFGKQNPVGKTLLLDNKIPITVTGVTKNVPENSSFLYDAILPFSFLKATGASIDRWDNNELLTFITLGKGADLKQVGRKLTSVYHEYNPQSRTILFPFPLADMHLHSHWGFGNDKGGIVGVYIFLSIALFILLIACINFINLSTAKSANRSREIGIRKVSGAGRKAMIVQFLLESYVIVAVALVVAILLVILSLGIFNTISGKNFTWTDIFRWKFIVGFFITGIMTGLLAGIYPAFYLSSQDPVRVLKGETLYGRRNGRLRQVLVVVQFSLSIFIALGAIFMYQQVKYMQEKELGFDKENLLCIPMSREIKKKYYALKDELIRQPSFEGVSAATWNPTDIGSNSGGATWDGKDPRQQVLIGTNGVDYDYLKTLKIKLLYGRDFSPGFRADKANDSTGNFLVNEEVARLMGGGDVSGRRFNFSVNGKIVGVMKNFHFEGADQPIQPMAFYLTDTANVNVMLVRIAAGNYRETLAMLERSWKKIIPDFPLEYTFIGQDYQNLYKTQMQIALLLKYFTLVAIIIACLGLYGLSAYSATRRTREIGVRKVMGAGMLSVMYSVSREFLTLVLISMVIAFPLAWYVIGKMLQHFAYRIGMNYPVFILTGLGALLIALLTISFQAIRAASVSPSVALKYE